MPKKFDKRIYAGFYRRYDGKYIYVVSTAEDSDSGEEIIIWKEGLYSSKSEYFTTTKKSFCEPVIVDGKREERYIRQQRIRITGAAVKRLEEDGFRGPVRKERVHPVDEYETREYQQAKSYYEYAKDLCEHYAFDVRKYNLCLRQKEYVGIFKSDFLKLREDLKFLKNAMETVLEEYKDYFQERFVKGMSIRKYAAAHKLNRGSVDHIQRKFFSALAQLLQERDEAEGKCRLCKYR